MISACAGCIAPGEKEAGGTYGTIAEGPAIGDGIGSSKVPLIASEARWASAGFIGPGISGAAAAGAIPDDDEAPVP